MSSRRKPRPRHALTADQIPLIRIHYSTGVVQLSETLIIDTRILLGTTQDSDMKTLRSLLSLWCSQLNSTIPAIRESSYVARSSPHSKHYNAYNAHIPMRVGMDSGENLCIAIPTIKRRELGGYKKIIKCKSCNYVDLKYPHPQRQLRRI